MTEAVVALPEGSIQYCGGLIDSAGIENDSAAALYARGIVSHNDGDFRGALSLFEQSCKAAPNWPLPRVGIALEKQCLGDDAAVIQACNEALEGRAEVGVGLAVEPHRRWQSFPIRMRLWMLWGELAKSGLSGSPRWWRRHHCIWTAENYRRVPANRLPLCRCPSMPPHSPFAPRHAGA